MKSLKVKKSWNGKVAIRDKYVEDALKNGTGIIIECMGEVMTIKPERVKYHAFKSSHPMKDMFSGESHYLYYYTWAPDGSEAAKKAEKKIEIKQVHEDIQPKLF